MISQHSTQTELYCADVKNALMTLSTAKSKIAVVNNANSFEGSAPYKIDFQYYPYADKSCRDMTSSDLSQIDVRYYVETDTSAECGGVSCIYVRGGQTLQHAESDGTATDYGYAILVLKESTMNGTAYDYLVNHETGHALGLLDGNGTCPGSIMHSADYGCGNGYPDWPTSIDKTTVNNEAAEETYASQ